MIIVVLLLFRALHNAMFQSQPYGGDLWLTYY